VTEDTGHEIAADLNIRRFALPSLRVDLIALSVFKVMDQKITRLLKA